MHVLRRVVTIFAHTTDHDEHSLQLTGTFCSCLQIYIVESRNFSFRHYFLILL